MAARPDHDPRLDLGGPVLVTGGAGYIGSHAARALRAHGVPTVVLDDLSSGHRAFAGDPFEQATLGDRAALAAVFARHRPAAVVHFAARCFVGESVRDPALYYRENVLNAFHLLEAMRASGCGRIVFSSTCATYGEPVAVPITEDHPQVPISPYGRTKLHMEHMMGDYATAYGIRFAALRYFNAAGAAEDGTLGELHDPETHLIPLVLDVALGRREAIDVFGGDYATPDGTAIRDYIHVEDLARAHVLALAKLGERPQIACNLGTGTGYSVLEVIEAVRRVTGRPVRHRIVGRRPGDPPALVSGGTRARELLGWEPLRPELDRIVADAWRFHRAARS